MSRPLPEFSRRWMTIGFALMLLLAVAFSIWH